MSVATTEPVLLLRWVCRRCGLFLRAAACTPIVSAGTLAPSAAGGHAAWCRRCRDTVSAEEIGFTYDPRRAGRRQPFLPGVRRRRRRQQQQTETRR